MNVSTMLTPIPTGVEDDGNFTDYMNELMSITELSLQQRAHIILSQPVSIISLVLCFLTIVANCLSICATVLGPPAFINTHMKLVISLGLSDLLVSFSVLLHILNKVFTNVPRFDAGPDDRLPFSCMTLFTFALHTAATMISLLNLLAMAVDHYVAIMNPLHYNEHLNEVKGNILIIVIWLLAFAGGFSVYLGDVQEFQAYKHVINYCEFVQKNDFHGEYLVFFIAFVCFFVITYTYLRIYMEVRRVYRQGTRDDLDYARNRKALLTSLLIIGTFVLCWLPTCVFQVALVIQVRVNSTIVRQMYATLLKANRYLNLLLLVNALCDPIVYAVRLKNVQLGYRRIFQMCRILKHKKRRHSTMKSERCTTQIARLQTMDIISPGICNMENEKTNECVELLPIHNNNFIINSDKQNGALI
ncbi:adenosine receptor A3 [Patella vulgata]|uniref:adenosine receptor A3 n=1 Tax=Patella vulgata TaxID=6465 RepID=UPI00217FAC56|nr:adenosine receptor A3 [Patella vulgata]